MGSEFSRYETSTQIQFRIPFAVRCALGRPAFAQGCAMCYATAKATPKDGQRALNRAILVMVIPPIGAITFGVGAAVRYSKKRDYEKGDTAL